MLGLSTRLKTAPDGGTELSFNKNFVSIGVSQLPAGPTLTAIFTQGRQALDMKQHKTVYNVGLTIPPRERAMATTGDFR